MRHISYHMTASTLAHRMQGKCTNRFAGAIVQMLLLLYQTCVTDALSLPTAMAAWPAGILYTSKETHYSVMKAARMYRMDAIEAPPPPPPPAVPPNPMRSPLRHVTNELPFRWRGPPMQNENGGSFWCATRLTRWRTCQSGLQCCHLSQPWQLRLWISGFSRPAWPS